MGQSIGPQHQTSEFEHTLWTNTRAHCTPENVAITDFQWGWCIARLSDSPSCDQRLRDFNKHTLQHSLASINQWEIPIVLPEIQLSVLWLDLGLHLFPHTQNTLYTFISIRQSHTGLDWEQKYFGSFTNYSSYWHDGRFPEKSAQTELIIVNSLVKIISDSINVNMIHCNSLSQWQTVSNRSSVFMTDTPRVNTVYWESAGCFAALQKQTDDSSWSNVIVLYSPSLIVIQCNVTHS